MLWFLHCSLPHNLYCHFFHPCHVYASLIYLYVPFTSTLHPLLAHHHFVLLLTFFRYTDVFFHIQYLYFFVVCLPMFVFTSLFMLYMT